MRLSRRPEPFDSDEYLYELKIDGFRALAHIWEGKGELVSAMQTSFVDSQNSRPGSPEHLKVENAVLDGEIACLDGEGRPISKICSFENRRASSSRLICFS